jgi:hypothetical protein
MKYTLAAAVLAILLPTAAHAQVICLKVDGKTPEPCESRQVKPAPMPAAKTLAVLPPPEYDKPFAGKLTEIRVGPAIMRSICPKTIYPVTLGCAYSTSDKSECVIVLVSDELIRAAGWTSEIVRRHEIGHCNGFPADHRGARPVG